MAYESTERSLGGRLGFEHMKGRSGVAVLAELYGRAQKEKPAVAAAAA